jgi:hypothetical protein
MKMCSFGLNSLIVRNEINIESNKIVIGLSVAIANKSNLGAVGKLVLEEHFIFQWRTQIWSCEVNGCRLERSHSGT